MAGKTIVVLATLDTKEHEAQYVREQIEKLGDKALVVDTGVVGMPAARADITCEAVTEAVGTSLAKLLDNPTRKMAAPIMTDGVGQIVTDLATKGEVHGIVAMGGGKVPRSLPRSCVPCLMAFPR